MGKKTWIKVLVPAMAVVVAAFIALVSANWNSIWAKFFPPSGSISISNLAEDFSNRFDFTFDLSVSGASGQHCSVDEHVYQSSNGLSVGDDEQYIRVPTQNYQTQYYFIVNTPDTSYYYYVVVTISCSGGAHNSVTTPQFLG